MISRFHPLLLACPFGFGDPQLDALISGTLVALAVYP